MLYKAKINNSEFELFEKNGDWSVDNDQYKIQIAKGSNNIIRIKDSNGTTHEAIIQHVDKNKKQLKVLINLKEVIIDLLDPMDIKMLSLGIDTKKLSKAKNIKAPMPGLILKTLVTEGQEVKAGEALFILEAMKMENVFKAPDDVTIKKILIDNGETVDKNQELIVFA